ncbi:hypothetical protein BGX23_005193, partial [Mortierella sp. AD031]
MSLWRATASSDGDDQKWSQIIRVQGFFGRVTSVAWRPNSLELVTGCNDGSLRVWRVVDGLDEFSAQMVWAAGYDVLAAFGTNVVDAVGLSAVNRLLLKQRGAIDGTPPLKDVDAKNDDEDDEEEKE